MHTKGGLIMKITNEEQYKEEQRIINNLLAYEKFNTYETDFFNTETFKRLKNTCHDYLPDKENDALKFTFFPKSEILRSGGYVIDKHFGKFNLNVRYTDEDNMYSQLVAIFGKKPEPDKFKEIFEYINNQSDIRRITDVPVELTQGNVQNGFCSFTYFYAPTLYDENIFYDYLKELPVCTKNICLSGDCNTQSKFMYVHEMCHALISRNKGAIDNMLNDEAFSIFMEKVAADDLYSTGDIADYNHYLRILDTKYNILSTELLEYEGDAFESTLIKKQYILSTLHATALFNTYLKGSNKIKKEIDNALGEVISGNDVLENVFEHYEATAEKGARIMQRQIKVYDKKFCK